MCGTSYLWTLFILDIFYIDYKFNCQFLQQVILDAAVFIHSGHNLFSVKVLKHIHDIIIIEIFITVSQIIFWTTPPYLYQPLNHTTI